MGKVKATPHAVYNINYHLVWIPKYRKSVLRGEMKERLKEIFSEIAEQYEFEIEEMSVQKDHVHLFVCAPPRYSPARLADILKSISSRKMMEEFPRLKRHLWLGKLWARGYYVGTSGDKVTAEEIKKYIKYYQHHTEQLELFAKETKEPH